MGPGTHFESMISITGKPNHMQIKTLADRAMVSKIKNLLSKKTVTKHIVKAHMQGKIKFNL